MPFADVNGTQLHYELRGPEHAPVVMLSNSLGSNLRMWDEQVPELTAAGFQVLLYDSRGHGQSAVPQGPYKMDMLARDAVGLLDTLGLDRVFFCGLSKGGMVGQMLGISHPERILALVLCSTSAHIGMPETWNERIKAVQEHGMQAVADATIDRWFTPAGQKRLPERVESVRRMVQSTPVQGFSASCEAIRDMDLRDSISAITLPTLIMVGEHDQGTPVSHAEFIHKQIPSSELRIISNAAHMIGIEQAEVFNKTLVDFLKAQTR